MDRVHEQVLRKFTALKGETLIGRKEIKGVKTGQLIPPDGYVDYDHILHDLIRGFYKPARKPYLLSYQATESIDNYGRQIRWINKENYLYEMIEMHPPNSPRDNRKKSDINAARYNMENQIPIGILLKEQKGVNIVLGTGLITEEREDGVFIVVPNDGKLQEGILNEISEDARGTEILTEIISEIKRRKGQELFRRKLKERFPTCALCDVKSEYSIASHIKSWAASSNDERLDENNGLMLCPNHDYLFDNGFITFEKNGDIIISEQFPYKQYTVFKIKGDINISLTEESKVYMKYHHENIFRKYERS